MQTAIQILYNEIIGDDDVLDMPIEFIQKITSKFAKAMDKEKEQIINSFDLGSVSEIQGEHYYNETYTKP